MTTTSYLEELMSHMLHAGTPMHHAAMANKKEMMFMLARLGCDWRSKADGINGATAAFVFCGQHGKPARQQVRIYTSKDNVLSQ